MSTPPLQWLLYGAYGYTGELIAREAVKRGLKPVLAGRDANKLKPLADELGLEYKAFPLELGFIKPYLTDIDLVLNCAGPFSATAAAFMLACIGAKVHYLDITGEIDVFEFAHTLHSQAQEAGIVICPGVGFDVIPTDCVAAALKAALPDANYLALGFDSRSSFSPGTMKTSIEGIAKGGKVRRNGVITKVPLAYKVKHIDFGNHLKSAMTIPWGDVSTAFHSTGIPNIEVYIPGSPKRIKNAKRANWFRPFLKFQWLQNIVKAKVAEKMKGPDAQARAAEPTYVWGEARNPAGVTKTARVKTANGYSLTITGALAVVTHIEKKQNVLAGGTYTPSKLMGSKLVEQLPESSTISIT